MKQKYTVYDAKKKEIIQPNLTRNAAIKMAKEKGLEYGSSEWVHDKINESAGDDRVSRAIKEYDSLKKKSIKDLRNMIAQNGKVVDVKGFDKQGAISTILRGKYGDKAIDAAMEKNFKEDVSFQKGDEVIIENAKQYDKYRKSTETGTVVGMIGEKVNVKLSLGSMTVETKDVKHLVSEGSMYDTRAKRAARERERNFGEYPTTRTGKPLKILRNGKPLKIRGQQVTANNIKHAKSIINKLLQQPFNKDAEFHIQESVGDTHETISESYQELGEDIKSFLNKYVKKYNKAMWWDGKRTPRDMMSDYKKMTDSELLKLAKNNYDSDMRYAAAGKSTPREFQIKAVNRELKRRYGITPGGKLVEDDKMKGKDPCWKGYEMIGKKKNEKGKEVPNCVPKEK